MNIVEVNKVKEILQKNRGKDFTLLANKADFTEIYGPGVDIKLEKGDKVNLRKYNYVDKKDKFMLLIEKENSGTIWVPANFIDINLKTKEDDK